MAAAIMPQNPQKTKYAKNRLKQILTQRRKARKEKINPEIYSF
jgi:hypothetical protein